MTNPIKFLISLCLLMVTGVYQGRGNFHKVIALSLKAKALCPKSKYILTFVYGNICDDYRRIKKYDEAIKSTKEAIVLFPEEDSFYRTMVDILVDVGSAEKEYVPYIEKYLKYHKKMKGSGRLMVPIIKLFRPDFDFKEYIEYIKFYDDQWTIWAEHILAKNRDQ